MWSDSPRRASRHCDPSARRARWRRGARRNSATSSARVRVRSSSFPISKLCWRLIASSSNEAMKKIRLDGTCTLSRSERPTAGTGPRRRPASPWPGRTRSGRTSRAAGAAQHLEERDDDDDRRGQTQDVGAAHAASRAAGRLRTRRPRRSWPATCARARGRVRPRRGRGTRPPGSGRRWPWPATRRRMSIGTWVTVQPTRVAITSDSTVSPRYSAG